MCFNGKILLNTICNKLMLLAGEDFDKENDNNHYRVIDRFNI
jgi:hypothetical protein